MLKSVLDRLSFSVLGQQSSNDLWALETWRGTASKAFHLGVTTTYMERNKLTQKGARKKQTVKVDKKEPTKTAYLVCVYVRGHSLIEEIRTHGSCLQVIVESC